MTRRKAGSTILQSKRRPPPKRYGCSKSDWRAKRSWQARLRRRPKRAAPPCLRYQPCRRWPLGLSGGLFLWPFLLRQQLRPSCMNSSSAGPLEAETGRLPAFCAGSSVIQLLLRGLHSRESLISLSLPFGIPIGGGSLLYSYGATTMLWALVVFDFSGRAVYWF